MDNEIKLLFNLLLNCNELYNLNIITKEMYELFYNFVIEHS